MLLFTLTTSLVRAADIGTITNAFKAGDTDALAGAMAKEVDLALPDESKRCGAQEAATLLKGFFGRQKPSGFTVVHHADKRDNGFFVAKLMASGSEYRVNVTYRTENGKATIQSIRIE